MRFFFDLWTDAGITADETGTEMPDSIAAVEYGRQIARELARNSGRKTRTFCIHVRDEIGNIVSSVPFSDLDEAIRHLPADTRALLEICFERRRDLSNAVRVARATIERSRATIARSRGKPYLVAGTSTCLS